MGLDVFFSVCVPCNGYGILRTDIHASFASNAFVGKEHQIRSEMDVLRIGAPPAAQRAALGKDQASDAGPVVNAEFLNVCDHSGRIHGSVSYQDSRLGFDAEMPGKF